ncbi:TIGR02452 family protein [Streptomyces sp. XY152]|uniref:TIGR02452 family protein n=1 Tax=Streptomyces sp. XY152 TaxID=1415560 RepID=UPI001F35E2CD|nr:TIGR02452 family protein [Streptomyces sp. XY152]
MSAPARHRPRDERSVAGADGGAPVPGGGHPNGAQAQEEALCRAFALCTCLPRTAGFHDRHRARRDPFRAGRVVHSPAVPVFRDDRGRPLDEPFTAGFPTSPAPHAGVIPRTAPQRAVEEPHAPAVRAPGASRRPPPPTAAGGSSRAPGAAGVFRDDPVHAAAAFRSHPEPGGRFAGAFAHVVFGVLDRTRDSAVRTAFERTSADLPSGPTAISSSRTAPAAADARG